MPTFHEAAALTATSAKDAAKDYSKGAQKGTFVSADERAAETGGELLYGLDKELAEKKAAKYDQELELACRAWVQQVAGVTFDEATTLQEELKSGVVLCQLCNAIKPGVCKKPSTMSAPFKQMENIAAYLTACDQLGVPKHSSFQTVTLYEDKDMMQVLVNLQALGSAAQRVPGYSGPTFGAKLADANVREFSEEVLKAGLATQTFLCTGSHGQPGTQSGMFDTNREIVKSNATPSATPTFLGTGSHGVSGTQSGMVDTRRNIVKAC